MSVLRRVNVLGQQRWEASDQRSVESAASNDFDGLVQSVLTGPSQGYVLRGFYLNNLPGGLKSTR